MNETFNFQRFGKYFAYDLKQTWRAHSRAAIMIGLSGVMLYFIWHAFGLISRGGWTDIPVGARVAVFVIAFTVLEIYQAITYGYLTDRKRGSAWLMIPASGTEKTVSMLLIVNIVIPVLFLVVFFVSDFLLAAVDPVMESSLLASFSGLLGDVVNNMTEAGVFEQFSISFFPWFFLMAAGNFWNFTFFLLCGICFKKHKVVYALLVILGISIVFSLLSIPAVSVIGDLDEYLEGVDPTTFVNSVLNWITAFFWAIDLALFAGVWYRVKTLKH